MARSWYAYTRPDALAVAMDASTTSVTLTDGATFPDPAVPGNGEYTIIIAYGTSREEVCTVTAKPTATVLTVTRHEDGSVATPKNIGDIVVHGVSARDFTDAIREGDPRLTDARFPTVHAATHGVGGADPVTPASIGAATTVALSNAMPIGAIIMWSGVYNPVVGPAPGWGWCDGSPHLSAALEAILGSPNSPDLRGRFIVGAGGSYARGATGGEASHTLTAGEQAPMDVYQGTSPKIGAAGGAGSGFVYTASAVNQVAATFTARAADGHTTAAPHENRPPYYALTYIIKLG